MDELVASSGPAGRLHATTDAVAAVCQSDISFVCVGTPSLASGKQNLTDIKNVFCEIGRGLAQKNSYHVVVLRSTVLPGTTHSLAIPCLEEFSGKCVGTDFDICFNPEFTREGTAVADFLNPPYTIIGAEEPRGTALLREVYDWIQSPVIETSVRVAEMVKYTSNAFHALKVTFGNEMGTLCKHFGVDTEAVMQIFVSDKTLNISPAYLSPGFAFGGSCLPKDLRALTYRAKELDLNLPLLEAVLPSNSNHIDRAVDMVLATNKKKIALLGLSFKAGTDDLRESPQVQFTKKLLGEGLQLRIWDPDVSLGHLVGSNRNFIEQYIPHIGMLLAPDLRDVVKSAEVVVVGTKSLNRDEVVSYLNREQIVIDLVNLDKRCRLSGSAVYDGLCW
jgi:GDP-mannose 6-dehydrogenase